MSEHAKWMNYPKSFLIILCLLSYSSSKGAAKPLSENPDQIGIVGSANCRAPTEEEKKWVPLKWMAFLAYTKICPLSSKGKIVLNVMAVDYRRYFEVTKKNTETLEKGLIVGPKGEKLGELPENFFGDGPHWLQLVFWSWEENFPQRIVPLLHSLSVSPDEAMKEMYFDPAEKIFKSSVP